MKSSIIVIFWIISTIILWFIFSMIFLNRDNHQVLNVLLKVVAAILATAVIFAMDIFKSEPESKIDVKVLFLSNKSSGNIVRISKPLITIDSAHRGGLSWLESYISSYPFLKVKFNDDSQYSDLLPLHVIEATFWTWIADKYPLHWDVEREMFYNGLGSGKGFIIDRPSAEKYPMKFDISPVLTNINPALKPLNYKFVALPHKAKVSIERTQSRIKIIIETSYISLEISIKEIGGCSLGYSELSEKLKSYLKKEYEGNPPPDCWASEFNIELKSRINVLTKWSPETKRQKRWASELFVLFQQEFDWNLIRNDLIKGIDFELHIDNKEVR